MHYLSVLKLAYKVTTHYPHLWILGLFLGTNFTINALWLKNKVAIVSTWPFIGTWDIHLSTLSYGQLGMVAGLLAAFVVVLVVTSWAKVLLVLLLHIILRLRRVTDWTGQEQDRELGDKRKGEGSLDSENFGSVHESLTMLVAKPLPFLARNIAISIFTTVVMVVGLIVLSLPFVTFAKAVPYASFIWLCAVVLLFFLTLLVSLLNVFASFFAVVLNQNYRAAINLATDLLIAKWQQIIGVVILLVVIYVTGSLLAWYLIHSLEIGIISVTQSFGGTHVLVGRLANVVLWLCLGVLNTFFYTALFILFSQLVRSQTSSETAAVIPQIPEAQAP